MASPAKSTGSTKVDAVVQNIAASTPEKLSGLQLYSRFALAGATCCSVTHGALTPVDVYVSRFRQRSAADTGDVVASRRESNSIPSPITEASLVVSARSLPRREPVLCLPELAQPLPATFSRAHSSLEVMSCLSNSQSTCSATSRPAKTAPQCTWLRLHWPSSLPTLPCARSRPRAFVSSRSPHMPLVWSAALARC